MAKRNYFGSYLKRKEEIRIKEEHDRDPKVIAARKKARKLQLLRDSKIREEFLLKIQREDIEKLKRFKEKQEEERKNSIIFHEGRLIRVKDLED